MAEKGRQILDSVIDSSFPFALLDFPDYDNIGDSAIYCGTTAYLRSRRMSPSYVSTTNNCDWDDLKAAIADGPILLQGGGNFGDLWPWFQPFREEVLRRHPKRPIIQMPQTIHYRSKERIDQTARAIERHGAFVLLVRDQASFDLARAHFACEVHLCPDMAFQIKKTPHRRPTKNLLLHFRTDQEAAGAWRSDETERQHAEICDWPYESSIRKRLFDLRALPHALPAYFSKGRHAARAQRYEARARARTERGFALLGSYHHVITDRLHGHIMCSLQQTPHRVIDNNYGKIGRYINTWGSDICYSGIFPDSKSAIFDLRNK